MAGDEAQLTQLLTGQDWTMVLGAVRTAIGGGLTEEDIRLISNRREQLKRFERVMGLLEERERAARQRVEVLQSLKRFQYCGGIIPGFLQALGSRHPDVTDLRIVLNMATPWRGRSCAPYRRDLAARCVTSRSC